MATRTLTRGVPTRPIRTRSTASSVQQSGRVADVADIQRARLLTGAVRAVDEFGYTRTTVTEITARAHVSRRTFYELFTNSEDCLAAMLDEMVDRLRSELLLAGLEALPWGERIRTGLWTILSFLDSEPALARVCVVQSARGGQRILERREQQIERLAEVLDGDRRDNNPNADCPPLTAEGLVGAALSIVHTRLLRGDSAPLTDLHGELMAMIVLPYLGPAAARQERKRSAPAPSPAQAGVSNAGKPAAAAQPDGSHTDPLQDISMRLTYRTMRVLHAIAESPGGSNRGVGETAGISDQGQISKLLARLVRYGLLENRGEGGHAKGEPNAWHLTPAGLSVAQIVAIGSRERGDRA
jgi:AcrR family transcriptional regulator